MNRRNFTVVILMVLLSLGSFLLLSPSQRLRIVFCDVGQGDAAMVYVGYFQALVDVGPSADKLNKCISGRIPVGDEKIDLVFISHSQRDHDGALDWLKKNFEIGRLVDSGKIGDTYRYKDIYFEVLDNTVPKEINGSEENDNSLVVLFTGGEKKVLFTGDISSSQELALLADGVLEKIDILKVAHHGSKYSTDEGFLEKVRPNLAVISVGAKNSYGHPARETLISFETLKIPIKRTDLDGEIEIEL